ncbi:autotransporter outer membrane beta-barrel domain-containing protein [Pseudomonas sp. B3G-3]|nr:MULTISPECIES: autotransporter outer membrane beta-barrel domain-containing protein [unclassified Pseudomonas]
MQRRDRQSTHKEAKSASRHVTSQDDVGFSNDLPRTALRLQTGVEGQVLKNVTINAHIGLEKSFDGSGLTSLNGQVGLNVAF